jgi:hypothetical protein
MVRKIYLGSIRMEKDSAVLRDLCNLFNRLDGEEFALRG